jgi:predicted transcriptional regulator of viral defense system
MMNTIQLLKRLTTYPTFNVNTVANIIEKDSPYTRLYLNRLKQRKIIHQLQRNVYTVQEDPLIIASRISWPSYISLWAALRYHNLTEQLPHTITVITTQSKSRREISLPNTRIIFEHIRPAWFFGFTKITISDFEVFMAEPEKALIDALLLKRISVSEIYSILQHHLKDLSTERLVEYILKTQNQALAKRFGWMLGSLGDQNVVQLKQLTYGTLIPLDYSRPCKGKKDSYWGIIMNIGEIG